MFFSLTSFMMYHIFGKPNLLIAYSNCIQHFINLCRVVETLKDYTMKAVVSTVDHLGSIAYKVNHCLDEKIGEVSRVELRFLCIQQVVLLQQHNYYINILK